MTSDDETAAYLADRSAYWQGVIDDARALIALDDALRAAAEADDEAAPEGD